MNRNNVTRDCGEESCTPPNGKFQVEKEPLSPFEDDFDNQILDDSFEQREMRKSLSMNDLASLTEDNKEIHRLSTPQSTTKFVSMAEAIYHYQREAPGRFHSTRMLYQQSGQGHSKLTRPQSPVLRCKARSRPVHIISQKEKEEMELEEIKKFKIKANPVPKAVLQGSSNLPDVRKKPNTIPKPFKLSKSHKKSPESIEEHIPFKARPVPRHIFVKPHVPPKPKKQITKPVSPKFHYKKAKSDNQLKSDMKQPSLPGNREKTAEEMELKKQTRHGRIHPEPFSFEKRDEAIKIERERRIQQKIEEENRQANFFKARPLSGAVKKQMNNALSKASSSTSSSHASENKENCHKFEPFKLSSEKRGAERHEFDKLLKKREEEKGKIKKLKEQELQEKEEKIASELRAKLVHQAKPVPLTVYYPFVPKKSAAPLTTPETPNVVRRLKERN